MVFCKTNIGGGLRGVYGDCGARCIRRVTQGIVRIAARSGRLRGSMARVHHKRAYPPGEWKNGHNDEKVPPSPPSSFPQTCPAVVNIQPT